MLFLANIQPELQRDVREQCAGARFVAMDSMNLWIDIARDALVRTIATVDCLILNDSELKQLTGAPNRPRGRAESLGWACAPWSPSRASTARRCSPRRATSRLPAFPLARVVEPTGAGDTFAGGLVGYVAAQRRRARSSHELLARAMAYGTALASFNVEGFGAERLVRLDREEIAERVEELRAMTRFEREPLALRA